MLRRLILAPVVLAILAATTVAVAESSDAAPRKGCEIVRYEDGSGVRYCGDRESGTFPHDSFTLTPKPRHRHVTTIPRTAPGHSPAPATTEGTTMSTTKGRSAPVPTATPLDKRKKTCPTARFGRSHVWMIGAFYWPMHPAVGESRTLYMGEDYAMCGFCGQIEEN